MSSWKDKMKLNKGGTFRYLLANAEWEGSMENQKSATDVYELRHYLQFEKLSTLKMNQLILF